MVGAIRPNYLDWLVKSQDSLTSVDGKIIEVYELCHTQDETILNRWADHFRNHYCLDEMIDALVEGTGKTKKEYLEEIVFPDERTTPGPSVRSGDFGEILISDYLEFNLGYWVPRIRYDIKFNRNESTKGVDVLGFKIVDSSGKNPEDSLFTFESKARLGSKPTGSVLQNAIDHSGKDVLRRATSLNAVKRRKLHDGDTEAVKVIQRFQNPVDNPYQAIYGAAAIISKSYYDETSEQSADCSNHPENESLKLVIIYGHDLMRLVHSLYRRAANEA